MSEEEKIAREMIVRFRYKPVGINDEFTTLPMVIPLKDAKRFSLMSVKWIVKEINLHYATRRHYRKQVLLKWEKVVQEINNYE